MSEHPLRVGLVGANAERSWAKVAHVPALRTLPEFTLTAVATRRLASAEAAAQAFGAMEAYDDFHQLVRSNNVDIVTVCVRVPFHLEVVMAALEAGKHVMCEWPLGRDIGEAEKMAEAARTTGVRTCIGLQGRMALAAQRAREMLSTGAIGRPLTASIYVPNTHGGPRVPAYLAYLMDPANGATMTTITGGHNIDLARFVLGPVRELAAWGTIMFPDVELVEPPGHVAGKRQIVCSYKFCMRMAVERGSRSQKTGRRALSSPFISSERKAKSPSPVTMHTDLNQAISSFPVRSYAKSQPVSRQKPFRGRRLMSQNSTARLDGTFARVHEPRPISTMRWNSLGWCAR